MVSALIHNDFQEIDTSGAPPSGGWDLGRVGGLAAGAAMRRGPVSIRIVSGGGTITLRFSSANSDRTTTMAAGDFELCSPTHIVSVSGVTKVRVGYAV